MRFQFWQDTLDNVFKNDVPQHPVALELSTVSTLSRNVLRLGTYFTVIS